MRRTTPVLAIAALAALAACRADPDAFYPNSASAEPLLEKRALERVPPNFKPTSVTVVREFGRPWPHSDVEIIGYDAWIRVEGCTGYVLVRFDSWGRHRTTGDMTKCG